mgnify:CR=1 FL=1
MSGTLTDIVVDLLATEIIREGGGGCHAATHD